MRILICTNSLAGHGGIERVTIVKANALADINGNEVAICFTDRGTYPENLIHPLSPKVKVYDLDNPFWDITSLSLKNLLWHFPKRFLSLRKKLVKLIDEYNPDVVVTTGQYEKYALATIPMPKSRIKIREYHFNSSYRTIENPKSLLAKIITHFDNNFLSRFFDKSFLLSFEDLNHNFLGNRRFDVMHNPCSFDVSTPPTPISSRNKTVVAIGRIAPVKNYPALLRIWQKVAPSHPDWKLEIIGGGYLTDLQCFISESNIPNVTFAGFQTNIENYLNQSKIFVMTSKYEGFPLVILEAMSRGVPPVVYKFPYGPKDIIENGENGILVENQNEDEFAEKLSLLMDNESLIQNLAGGALQRVKDFSTPIIIDRWMQKYHTLLEEKQKS